MRYFIVEELEGAAEVAWSPIGFKKMWGGEAYETKLKASEDEAFSRYWFTATDFL